jgi:hypothetical protein
MNTECYQMLVLVRELDDRFGGSSGVQDVRRVARVAQRHSPVGGARAGAHGARAALVAAISAAFAEGRLTVHQSQALTRVADLRQEDLLLAYALETTAENVEERCRQMRNVAPESVHDAQRAWANRSLTMWRTKARHDAAHGRSADRGRLSSSARALDCRRRGRST